MDGAYSIPNSRFKIRITDEDKPAAIDLSHHLSKLSKARMNSPLKSLFKYAGRPGIVMLAGGLPSADYFPYESISAQVLVPNSFKTIESAPASWIWNLLTGKRSKPTTTTITVLKHVENATLNDIQLSTALQYGQATGLPALSAFNTAFVAKMFNPGYSNYETMLCAGSTAAWEIIVSTLCEEGDGILAEEWTYSSALATAWPHGVLPVALKMDGEGMTPEDLEDILGNWDVGARGGMRRPRVMYTVPVTQNPTGSTMSAARKQKIYAICVKYDVIIVEDDPYYFLQAGNYQLPSSRTGIKAGRTETDSEFLASLVPSYLKFDTQGRVIRIDTFSKTICPGSRLGFITTNPIFAERLLRAAETSTQAPCGFGQALIAKLLVEEWKMDGYIRWLKGLKAQYRDRRDMLVDALLDSAHAGLDSRMNSQSIITLSLPSSLGSDEKGFRINSLSEKDGKINGHPILSFVAPQGGMFVWLRVHLSLLPRNRETPSPSDQLMDLWELIAESGLLIAPGTIFSARDFGKDVFKGRSEVQSLDNVQEEKDGYFRIAFSTATKEEVDKAMGILVVAVLKYFKARL